MVSSVSIDRLLVYNMKLGVYRCLLSGSYRVVSVLRVMYVRVRLFSWVSCLVCSYVLVCRFSSVVVMVLVVFSSFFGLWFRLVLVVYV